MANKENVTKEVKETEPKAQAQTKPEVPEVDSVYSIDEFVEARERIFEQGIKQECIVAAFRLAGIEQATVDEAKRIVRSFRKKEVI